MLLFKTYQKSCQLYAMATILMFCANVNYAFSIGRTNTIRSMDNSLLAITRNGEKTTTVNQAGNSVKILGMEITQGLQSMSQSNFHRNQCIPLHSGKKACVRVYLNVYASADSVKITGKLKIEFKEGKTIVLNPEEAVLLKSECNDDLTKMRSDSKKSLNFIIPAKYMIAGEDLSIKLTGVEDEDKGESVHCTNCANYEIKDDVEVGKPLCISVIGISYTYQNKYYSKPSQRHYEMLCSWLKRAYPISELDAKYTTLDLDLSVLEGMDKEIWSSEVYKLVKGKNYSENRSSKTLYYAMIPDAGIFIKGIHSSYKSNITIGPTGNCDWGWDIDSCYGDWYGAHEIGHMLGAYDIAGPKNGRKCWNYGCVRASNTKIGAGQLYMGFDLGDTSLKIPMRAYDGRVWNDFMTYCEKLWIGPKTYSSIRERLSSGNLCAPSQQKGNREYGWYTITGKVYLNQSIGHISSVIPTADIIPDDSELNPDYKLWIYRDANELPVVKALKLIKGSASAADTNERYFEAHIKAKEGVRIVKLLKGDEILDQRISNGKLFQDSIRVELGSNVSPDQPITLDWKLINGASSVKEFGVQISRDSGFTYETITLGQKGNRYLIRPENLEKSADLKVRLILSDGVQSKIVDGGSISIE